MDQPPILIAAASRPYPGEVANGDIWTVQWHDGGCRITVIDGLGHGPEAERAARAAVAELETRPALSPDEALRACHGALAGTRGAAASVVQIDPRTLQLTFVGAGNVEGRLWQAGREQRLVPQRGIVGATLPRLRPSVMPLAPEWLLVLHTDGVRTRLHLDAASTLADRAPQRLATDLLNAWARPTDDATVVVALPADTRPREA